MASPEIFSQETSLHRIPNANLHEPTRIAIKGEAPLSIRELADTIQQSTAETKKGLIENIVPSLTDLSESEVWVLTQLLLNAIIQSPDDDTTSYEDILLNLNSRNASHPEAISFAAQIIKTLEKKRRHASPARISFTNCLLSRIATDFKSHKEGSKKLTSRDRFTLLRCLETSCLRNTTSDLTTILLCNGALGSIQSHRTFAGEILKIARGISHPSPEMVRLKTYAAKAYLTGNSHHQGQQASRNISSNPTAHTSSRLLIEKIIQDNGQSFVQRLLARDFKELQQTSALDLQTFDLLTSRLLPRAVSEPWARIALLSIVRAPHQSCVSLSKRANTLGSLIAGARRNGLLTQDLEQEVLATSAHLTTRYSDQSSDSLSTIEPADLSDTEL